MGYQIPCGEDTVSISASRSWLMFFWVQQCILWLHLCILLCRISVTLISSLIKSFIFHLHWKISILHEKWKVPLFQQQRNQTNKWKTFILTLFASQTWQRKHCTLQLGLNVFLSSKGSKLFTTCNFGRLYLLDLKLVLLLKVYLLVTLQAL